MIFVTVGTHTQPFDRLVQGMDELALEMGEEVMIQYGSSTYVPNHARGFQWISGARFEQLMDESRVVVSHAGSGTIIASLLKNKPLVLVPRQQKFHEHIDDHQKQLSRIFAERSRAAVVYDVSKESLQEAIVTAAGLDLSYRQDSRLTEALHNQLLAWDNR